MALLFVIAGISTYFSLKKRTSKEYLKERTFRLLIPFVSGLILLVPVQTFFAEKFHNGFTGSYFSQLITFFTKFGDLSGYTGGFTPGHLWFILYLFIISLLGLLIIRLVSLYKNSSRKLDSSKKLNSYNSRKLNSFRRLNIEKINIISIIPLFLIFLIMWPIINIDGKSIGGFLALFMLGYFILSNDRIQGILEKNKWYLSSIFIVCSVISLLITPQWSVGIFYDCFMAFLIWMAILSMIGLGKKYLSFHNDWSEYLTKASYPIFIFHQTWIVVVAYYTFLLTSSLILQIVIILFGSFILTIISYEIIKRTKLTRFLFGIKE